MARIRTLKPEFWTDEKVVGLPYEARLFFQGMWNFADDCGHIEDEPVRLKLQILPNDPVDARALLDSLIDRGFVERLKGCLLITNFKRHQRIDKSSTCRFGEDSTKPLRGSKRQSGVPAKNGLGMEGKGGERKGREEPSSPPAEDDFETFWNLYPRRNGKRLYKKKAQQKWRALSDSEKESVFRGVKFYGKACSEGLAIAADAFRWLRDRAWEDWQEPAKPDPSRNGFDPRRDKPAPYRQAPPAPKEPACEHSDPMCADCRRANLQRLKEATASVGVGL